MSMYLLYIIDYLINRFSGTIEDLYMELDPIYRKIIYFSIPVLVTIMLELDFVYFLVYSILLYILYNYTDVWYLVNERPIDDYLNAKSLFVNGKLVHDKEGVLKTYLKKMT